jgi:hypothetical protein
VSANPTFTPTLTAPILMLSNRVDNDGTYRRT